MFLAGTILVVLFTSHQIGTERETTLTHWKSRLATIAADRARLVSSWLAARRADAELLAAFPAVRAQLADQGRDDEALARHLSRVAAAYGYVGIVVSDANGHAAARSASDTGLAAGLLEQAAEQAARVARSRKPHFELAGEGAGRLLVVTVPIFSDGAPAGPDGDTRPLLGVVTLAARPEAGLYPLLADDAEPTHASETLLVDLEAGPPAFLSPLRQPIPPDAEMSKRALVALAAIAGAGAQGHEAVGETVDHRGVPVLAAVRRVAATGWSLVLKVDRDEALADFQRSGRLAGAAAAFLLLALAGFLIALHREQQRARLLREQMRQARAMTSLQSYADKIVASVPAGLLLLSEDLHVLSANRAFLESFRLREEDVLGRDLQQLVRAERLVRGAREVARHRRDPAGRPLRSLRVRAARHQARAHHHERHPPGRRRAPAPAPDRRGPHRGGAAAGGPPGVGAALPRSHPGARRHRVGGGRAHARLLLRQPPRRDRARLPGGALAARARLLGPPHPPGGPRHRDADLSHRDRGGAGPRVRVPGDRGGRPRGVAARHRPRGARRATAGPPPCAASRWTSPS